MWGKGTTNGLNASRVEERVSCCPYRTLAAGGAFLDHQPVPTRRLEVAGELTVIFGNRQEHSTVFDLRHGAYLRRMRALPVTGLAHPRFMEISASRT